MNEDIERIIYKLEIVKNNIEKYYEIRKYINEMLLNKNKINNNNIKNDIKEIINDDNINNKFKKIMDIYYKMEYQNEMIIRYKINKNEKEIRIFGDNFIYNNKNKSKIIYKEKENRNKRKMDFR